MMRRAGVWTCHFGAQIAVFKSNHATPEAEPCTSESPTMHLRESNHASCRAEPCKLWSPTMQVAERNHALLRVHGSVRTAMVGAI